MVHTRQTRKRLSGFSDKFKIFWTAGMYEKALVLALFLFFWFLRKMVHGVCVLIVMLLIT